MDVRLLETAHDMKMPIQLIFSCAQMLEMQPAGDEHSALYLKMLMESARELKSMVLTVLDCGCEAEEGLNWERRDVVEEARAALRCFAISAREKGVSLFFSANVRSFVMETDGAKLRRLMRNLLSNALHATCVGGKIEVRVEVRGDALEIKVSDSGCGISSEDLPKITRAGFTTGGHGLGLSIVEKYARMLGGCLLISSEAQVGSDFSVHLPVRREKISV